jgi:diaminohydroxyphosphoribosylaminopyrimidine deaminase/5-amino-6-(5-phosphoribosylamino)uracil reductase
VKITDRFGPSVTLEDRLVTEKEQYQFDQAMSQRALDLAREGIGLVSPNPLVGCVIVSADGMIVGEGTYFYDRVTHAEVAALKKAGEQASGGTAYVSLEPHAHHGKTPPCTEALINAGITRVVAPIEDPNPLVSGKGFERLREGRIEVVTGIFADQADKLNEKFRVWHQKQRPFVHLKLAMSLDGRISLNQSVSTALSGMDALNRVHQLRHEYDAILVGGNTAFIDNPSLTDRSGKPRRRKLVRVVLDNRLRIPLGSILVTTARETPTLVISNSSDEEKAAMLCENGVEVLREDARDLRAVLECLRQRELQGVLVEGGTEVAGAFCDSRLVDKLTFIAAPIVIGGNSAPFAIGGKGAATLGSTMHLSNIEIVHIGPDIELTGYPDNTAS